MMADAQEAVIKVSGALKGVVRLPSFQSTTRDLRSEVARLLGEELWWHCMHGA